MIQIRSGIDPLLLFVQVDLEPDQGVETVPFCFDDRVVGTDVLSIQASFLGDESEDELGRGFWGGVIEVIGVDVSTAWVMDVWTSSIIVSMSCGELSGRCSGMLVEIVL